MNTKIVCVTYRLPMYLSIILFHVFISLFILQGYIIDISLSEECNWNKFGATKNVKNVNDKNRLLGFQLLNQNCHAVLLPYVKLMNRLTPIFLAFKNMRKWVSVCQSIYVQNSPGKQPADLKLLACGLLKDVF